MDKQSVVSQQNRIVLAVCGALALLEGALYPLPVLAEPDLDLINISLRWAHSSERLSVALGIDNLTDEEYRIHGDYQTSFGWVGQTFDRGRQWYLTAGYEF